MGVISHNEAPPRQHPLPTVHLGEWESPAPTPVTPQVSTPPRPWVVKDMPNTWSILCFRVWVTAAAAFQALF